MDALWADLLPKLWPAFWTTIKLTVYSAIGSFVLGTILTAMRAVSYTHLTLPTILLV